jgi:hypothetical protein
MTFGDRAEVRRAKVGTKVLAFGCAIFAVLGSFWTIVWFIRSYVEPPRVTLSPALALAAIDSKPAAVPAPSLTPTAPAEPTGSISQAKPVASPPMAEAAPANPPAVQAAPAEQPNGTSSIADRWAPITAVPALEPAPAAPPQPETMAAAPVPAADQPAPDEIAESSTPSISGPAPLPRRKPLQTAAVRARTAEPPLPRPRPDGPAPQSVWTAVPTTDDRYQAGQ